VTAFFPKVSPGDRIGVMGLPPFHSLGVAMQLQLPLAYLGTAVVYPPQVTTDQRAVPIVLTSDNILDGVRRTRCKAMVVVPTFSEQWAASTEAIGALTKLDQVVSLVSTLIDSTPDHVCCRSLAAVHLRKRSGMRYGLLVSISAWCMVGQNLVPLFLLAGEGRWGVDVDAVLGGRPGEVDAPGRRHV